MPLRALRWVLFSNRRGIIVLVIACAILASLFRSDSPRPLRQTHRLPLLPARPYLPEATSSVCPLDHNCPLSSPNPDPDDDVVTYDDTPIQQQKIPNPNVNSGTTPNVILDNTQIRNALFPIFDPHLTDGNVWIDENNRQLKALFRCVELSNCRPNQAKVVILHSFHFTGALWGWVGGEDMWARSTIQALKNMGYTYLYVTEQTGRALQLYQLFPDLVVAVLMESQAVQDCFQDTIGCLKSGHHPHGIPAWKIFAFYFWTDVVHPLGPRWTLSPENYTMENPDRINNYLGYSVEPSCLSHEFIPPAERPKQGYVMAKKSSYLAPHPDRPWTFDDFDKAAEETGVQLVSGLYFDGNGDQQPQSNVPDDALPKSVKNYGSLQQPQFIATLSNSRVLIGVGLPFASPTPYEALCLGVPFINPVVSWDPEDKMNKLKWGVQHGLLKFEDPPYVYNVFKGDQEGFVQAIKDAINTPIDRYILPRMTIKAVEARMRGILENDWYKVAEDLLADRVRKGEGIVRKKLFACDGSSAC